MSEIINLDNSFDNLHIQNSVKNKTSDSSFFKEKELLKLKEFEHDEKVNKLIEEASAQAEWVTMSEDEINDFMEHFIEYSDDNNIEWDRFNYEVFGYDYYKSRFPKFDDDIIEILIKCSEKKIYNDVKPQNKIEPRKPLTQEDFIVKFD